MFMSKIRLHVHFGMHRTGTTSIHRSFFKSKDELFRNGVLYPELGVDHRHVKLAWGLKSGHIKIDTVIKDIIKECGDSTKLIVLSSEDFCLLNIKKFLTKLSDSFNVTVSIYLRRQDTWLESWYNQHIKWPWSKKFSTSTPEFFIENAKDFYWLDYEKLLGEICAVLPEDSVYVNTMEKSGVTNTAHDLVRYLGVGDWVSDAHEDKNASLSYVKLQVLRQIDLMDVQAKARKKIIDALTNMDIPGDSGSKRIFSEPIARRIMKAYEKSNCAVAKRFFGRENLFIDNDFSSYTPVVLDEEEIRSKYVPELLKRVAKINRG